MGCNRECSAVNSVHVKRHICEHVSNLLWINMHLLDDTFENSLDIFLPTLQETTSCMGGGATYPLLERT